MASWKKVHKLLPIDAAHPAESITRHNSPCNVDFDLEFELDLRFRYPQCGKSKLPFYTLHFLATWYAAILVSLKTKKKKKKKARL